MPGTRTEIRLCMRPRIMTARMWRNCCWPSTPTSMPGSTTARRLCTGRRMGNTEMVELLLAHQADVNTRNKDGGGGAADPTLADGLGEGRAGGPGADAKCAPRLGHGD